MPKDPRLTAEDVGRMLLQNGFRLLRVRGSHQVYGKGSIRVVVPHHAGKTLHPKIVRQVLKAIADSLQGDDPLAS